MFPQALWWVWRVTLVSVCTVPVKPDWKDSHAHWRRKLLPGIYEWTWWLQVLSSLFLLLLLLLINLHISCHRSNNENYFHSPLLGFIQTDMTAGLEQEDVVRRIPLGRFGEPAEVAHAVLFLLESPYITGQLLLVDGGLQLVLWWFLPAKHTSQLHMFVVLIMYNNCLQTMSNLDIVNHVLIALCHRSHIYHCARAGLD